MRAHADNRRLGFQCTRDVQHILSERLVRPARLEIAEHSGDALDADDHDGGEGGLLEVDAQVLRAGEVRVCEVSECACRIPMLSVYQILVAYSKECGIEHLARETIPRRRISRNRRDDDRPRREEHAMRLAQGAETIA